MKKTNTDLTLEQCDELREITLARSPFAVSDSDDDFEAAVEDIANRCNGDFSPANWKRNC